jgi:hypothetical protein
MTDLTQPAFPVRPVGARPGLPLLERPAAASLFNIEAIALCLYFVRDACAGAMRYYAAVLHIDAIWFVPDIIAVLCIVAFAYRHAIKSPNIVAILTMLHMIVALYIGYVFLETANGAASAFKMIAPVFVGFCFCGRDLKNYKSLLLFLHIIFYVSILGVILSAHVRFPWVGYSYESFGATRQAGRLWWSAHEQRLAGFAADSTMAAYFILITYVTTSIRRSVVWCLVWAPIAVYAINLTTSKTSVGILLIYLICLLFVRFMPERHRFFVVNRMALCSFFAIFVPVLLMIFFTGTNLAHTYKGLYSLQDRINNSWQLPFVYMSNLMPFGFVSGCGLGCFNYPQQLFSNKVSYYVPVDNFYIGTYLMFGPLFVAFIGAVILAIARTRDIYKLTVVLVMNLFTITVLSYGPASGLLMIGFAFSDVFGDSGKKLRIEDAPTLAPRDSAELIPRVA